MDVEISPRSSAEMRVRHFYNNYTSLPLGTPTEWDAKLKDFDPDLSLRYNNITGTFTIFYDHHNKLTAIRSFGQNGSFGRAFANVRYNSILNQKRLIQMRKDLDAAEEARHTYNMDQCAAEFGEELHHSATGRVINDSVDAYAPEKPGLGGEMI